MIFNFFTTYEEVIWNSNCVVVYTNNTAIVSDEVSFKYFIIVMS